MATKTLNFSIPRHPMPVIIQAVTLVIVTDLLYALIAGIVTIMKGTLDIEVTFALLLWFSYIAKMVMTSYGVYLLLADWLNDNYFVINNNLIINSKTAKKSTSSRNLKELRGVKVDQTNHGTRRGYGDITLEFAVSGHHETVVLRGVVDPSKIAAALGGISKS